MNKKNLRHFICAALISFALPALADDYGGYLDTSILTVPTRSARDEVMKLLEQGESFQYIAVALSTDRTAARAGRRPVFSCHQLRDESFGRLLCNAPLMKPVPLYFTDSKDWAITIVHNRTERTLGMGSRGYPVPVVSEPDATFYCHNTDNSEAEAVEVKANTRSRSSFIGKERAYLQITSSQLVFLTGLGQKLVIERATGDAVMRELENNQAKSLKCGPSKQRNTKPSEAQREAPPQQSGN